MDSLNELKDAFREEKLEELLVANWTQFLDSFKLLNPKEVQLHFHDVTGPKQDLLFGLNSMFP